VDIYVYYGSDGSAALRAGADLVVGLIGPGVDASHAYERTHQDALLHTTRLAVAYLLAE
jgi:putative aminopeptidase FrvX